MKFTKVILLGVMAMFAFSSCEDFLDSENYTGKDSTNFPGTEKDVDQMVAAVYKSTFYAPFEANTLEQYFSVANLFSDDMFGGAGKGDPHWKALGHLMYNQGEQLNQLWVAGYEAIARANAALAVVDNIADEEKRNQTKGELLFHRAYNYYNLVLAFNRYNRKHYPRLFDLMQREAYLFKHICTSTFEISDIVRMMDYSHLVSFVVSDINNEF